MNTPLFVFIQYYLLGLLVLLLSGILGKLILKTFNKNFSLRIHTSTFSSILIGLTCLITVFSIALTRFQTVNIGFLLLFLFVIIELKRSKVEVSNIVTAEEKFSLKYFLFYSIAYLIFCLWEATLLLKFGEFPFVLPHTDFAFSSNISESLLMGGSENFFMEGNFYNPDYRFMMPYHYFEIWLNTLIVYCFGTNNLVTFMLCAFPILYFLIWIGVVSIFEHYLKVLNWKVFVLSFLLLFTGGIFITYFEKINFLSVAQVFTPVPMELALKKYSTFYVFIVAGFLLIINKRISLGLLLIMAVSLVSITAFPPILAGLLVFYSLALVFKLVERKTIFISFGYLLALSFFIALTYFYFNKSPFGLAFTNEKEINQLSKFLSFNYIKTFGNVIIGASIQTFIVYIPAILLIFFIVRYLWIKKKYHDLILPGVVVASILISSLFIWALLWEMMNSTGFYASSLCYLNVFLMITFIAFYKETFFSSEKRILLNLFILFLVGRLILAIFFNWTLRAHQSSLFSDKYLNEIKVTGKKKGINPLGVFIMSKEKYKTIFDKNAFFRRLGLYLKFFEDYKFATNISILDAPISSLELEKKREEGLIRLSVFYQFIENQKKAGVFFNIEQSQIDFIDQYKIDYLIVESQAKLSSLLTQRIAAEIKDPLSGERFILLKN